jgi:hypothetical protein
MARRGIVTPWKGQMGLGGGGFGGFLLHSCMHV